MRRRNLFTLAAGASAVVCAGVCVLWARSYSTEARPTGEFARQYIPGPPDRGLITPGDLRICVYSQQLRLSSRGQLGAGRIDGREELTPVGVAYLSEPGRAPEWLWENVRPPALGGRRDVPLMRRWGFIAVHGAEASGGVGQGGAGVFAPILSALPPGDNVRYWWVGAPHWFFAVLAGMLPTRWGWAKLRADFLRRAKRCRACGYDLRATPDRCPECGTAAGGAAAVAEPAPADPVAPRPPAR